MLLHKILSPTKLNLLLWFWLISIFLVVRNYLVCQDVIWVLNICIDDPPGLSSLQLSVLVLNMLWSHHLWLTVGVLWYKLLLSLRCWLQSCPTLCPVIHYSTALISSITWILVSIRSVLTISILIQFHLKLISGILIGGKLLLTSDAISCQLRLTSCCILSLEAWASNNSDGMTYSHLLWDFSAHTIIACSGGSLI